MTRKPLNTDVKPSAETLTALNGIITEIGAGKVLSPRDPEDHAHNGACDRAISIISHYVDGYGLFQTAARGSKE